MTSASSGRPMNQSASLASTSLPVRSQTASQTALGHLAARVRTGRVGRQLASCSEHIRATVVSAARQRPGDPTAGLALGR